MIKHITEKAKDWNKKIYVTYIDIEKVFGRVPRKMLMESFTRRNVKKKLETLS